MNLILTRKQFLSDRTIGTLTILNDKFSCYTMEDTVREPGIKIAGQTAIPFGIYAVVLSWSPHFAATVPLIMNVPGFDGIRIHPGVDPSDTEGCPLVGYGLFNNVLSRCWQAYGELYGRLYHCYRINEQVSIQVLDGR